MSDSGSAIEDAISAKIEKEGRAIRNKAAFGALVKLIPIVGDSLLHALTAGDDAIKDVKQASQIDLLCELVQKIDDNITQMLDEAKAKGVPFVEVSGEIHARGEDAHSVIGLDMSSGRSATIKSGTVVTAEGKNVTNITGVKL